MQDPGFDPRSPSRMSPIRPRVFDSVRFPFQGPDWTQNLLLGLVFLIIPLVGPIALGGYGCEILQRLERGDRQPVPKLDLKDFVHYLMRGMPSFVVQLVYGFPLGFVIGGLVSVLFVAMLLGGAADQPWVVFGVIGVASLVTVVVTLIGSVFIHGARLRSELTEDIAQGLAPGPMLSYVRATWGQILRSTLLFAMVAWWMAILGYLLCFVGIYPAIVAIQLGSVHLRWQIYRHYLASGGERITPKPRQELPSEALPVPAAYAPPSPSAWR